MSEPSETPVARRLGETSLMFLVDHTLSVEQMGRLADTVAEVMAMATLVERKWPAFERRRRPRVIAGDRQPEIDRARRYPTILPAGAGRSRGAG